jgi:hypothetical protein
MVKGWELFGTKILIIGRQQKEINLLRAKRVKASFFWGKPQIITINQNNNNHKLSIQSFIGQFHSDNFTTILK